MNNIAIFFHLHQVNNWKEIYEELMTRIVNSGLYDRADHIHVGINGTENLPDRWKVSSFEFNKNIHLESDTLYRLWEYCKANPKTRVMYIHAKGVSWYGTEFQTSVTNWRDYLSYFVIDNWKISLEKLKAYDCVGSEWIHDSILGGQPKQVKGLMEDLGYPYKGHYAGNFWWANADYISKLNPNFIFEENTYTRFKGEFWIGTEAPNYFNFHSIKRKDDAETLYDVFSNKIDYKQINIMKPIAIFYHVYQYESETLKDSAWENMFTSQINRLIDCGLYDAASYIQINVNGTKPLPVFKKKFNVKFNRIKDCEAETLTDLWKFCSEHEDYAVLYFHTKGISLVDSDANVVQNLEKWRDYIEYFNLDTWKVSLDKLQTHDCAGTEQVSEVRIGGKTWDAPCYGGNFWWANASYIKKLNPEYLHIRKNRGWWRWASEFWIGTGNPKMFNYYTSPGVFGKDKYFDPVTKEEAIQNMQNTTIEAIYDERDTQKYMPKICMISMFKNEANNIRRMLDSVAPYISFWVLQDNGSTDGTPEIVKDWAEKNNIPGILYGVEEGWVNFGWNRDHLLQTTLKSNHGCEWIMKMDCDETLEVDSDFDWNEFNVNHYALHVTSVAPGLIYNRAWIWKAGLPWRFNHDPAHETISLDMDGVGERFYRHQLSKSFRMRAGESHGESYTIPTKYVSDALKLEEKLLRENTMLTDTYHFWYIGKSYEDCYRGNFYPLGSLHQQEYARRCIFYFENVIKHIHGSLQPTRIDEMCYYAMTAIGNAYRFLGEPLKAIEYYNLAEPFCARRNDHLIFLAETYGDLQNYKKMHEYASMVMLPERTNPFPDFMFIINTEMYHDTGSYPKVLYDRACQLVNSTNKEKNSMFLVNTNAKKRFFVVDNFYADPMAVRNFAMAQDYEVSSDWYKGRRTFNQYLFPGIRERFDEIMGIKIREWESHAMNGRFQYCVPEDRLVYHYDAQTWAAMIYLTPDAPYPTGTSFYAHRQSRIRHIDEHPQSNDCFAGGFYDSTKFELVDTIGNVFNRLVIFDARLFHAASGYFGQKMEDARLFQIFFFD